MRGCNETVTVYNRKLDREKGYDIFHSTVITGVSWYARTLSNVDSSGLSAADVYTIRIPVDADFSGKAYVAPHTYKATGDPETMFTLQSGDLIVKGEHTESGVKLADLQALCGEVCTVLGITDNTKAPHGKHWRVTGK